MKSISTVFLSFLFLLLSTMISACKGTKKSDHRSSTQKSPSFESIKIAPAPLLNKDNTLVLDSSVLKRSIEEKHQELMKVFNATKEQRTQLTHDIHLTYEQSTTAIVKYRPKQCPLRVQTEGSLGEIYQGLNSIQNSFSEKCKKSAEGQTASLQSALTELQEMRTTQEENLNESQRNLMGDQTIMALGALNNIVQTDQCLNDIRKSGALPFISSIIRNASSIGFAINNPAASGFALIGNGISIALDLAHSLFRRRFNFKNPEERVSFLDLNCSFYEVQNNILKTGLLGLETGSMKKKSHQDLDEVLQRYHATFSTLEKKREDLLLQIEKHERETYHQNFPQEAILREFSTQMIDELSDLVIITDQDQLDHAVYLKTLDQLEAFSDQLEEKINAFTHPHVKHLSSFIHHLLEALSEQSVSFFRKELIAHEWHPQKLKNLVAHVLHYAYAMKDQTQNSFDTNQKSHQKSMKHVLITTDKVLQSLALVRPKVTELTKRVQLIKEIEKQRPGLNKQDATTLFEVLNSYQEISNYIYGKFGNQFSRRMLKELKKSAKAFDKAYKKVYALYKSHYFSSRNDLQFCQNYHFLSYNWAKAKSSYTLLENFYLSHSLLFTDLKAPGSFLRESRRRAQEKLKTNYESLIHALKEIEGIDELKRESWELKQGFENSPKSKDLGDYARYLHFVEHAQNNPYAQFKELQNYYDLKCSIAH